MSRRRSTYRRRAPARSGRPSLFWGRALLAGVILMILWAHWKGQG